MSERKPISKSKRFEIFERDQFTCQYCGEKPPKVILHVDHIIPVVKGGCNEPENLRTSCSSCNLGKHTKKLKTQDFADNPRRAQEALEAIDTAKVFSKATKSRNAIKEGIETYVQENYGIALYAGASNTISIAITEFGSDSVLEWLDYSFSKLSAKTNYVKPVDLIRYFCGILKNQRLEQ